jgi:hypothetical protein
MAMRIADQVTLKLVTEGSDDSSPRSELVLNSIPTGTHIQGATLEAAVEWNSYYLLFTTDDVPYEEMLRIVDVGDPIPQRGLENRAVVYPLSPAGVIRMLRGM